MPIIDLQRRLREIGRIRIGQQVPIANPKAGSKARARPVKLETFRLTSRDQRIVEAAAGLYGGEPRPWEEQPGQWEVVTTAAELPILVPPGGLALTQWYELWSGGGCLRRCDGQYDVVGDQGCRCDPEHRECKIHTRLSVVLSELQGLGVWRLDTQGWYAATEIGFVVPLLEGAAERGRFLPARLRLEQRQVLRDGKTNKFAVPVIDIDMTLGQMRALVSGGPPATLPIEAASVAELESGPGLTPMQDANDGPSVGEQMKTAEAPASRSRPSTPHLPSTGVRPRSRGDAEAAVADKPTLGASRPAATSEDEATRRAQQLAITLNGFGYDDDGRHHLIAAVTNGAKTSGKTVTDEEAAMVVQAAHQIRTGRFELVQGDDGQGWMLAPVVEKPPAVEADAPSPADTFDGVGDESSWTPDRWRQFLSARGVKVTELIREAQKLAGQLDGVDPPGSIEQIVGVADLCSLLRGFVEALYEERSGK